MAPLEVFHEKVAPHTPVFHKMILHLDFSFLDAAFRLATGLYYRKSCSTV